MRAPPPPPLRPSSGGHPLLQSQCLQSYRDLQLLTTSCEPESKLIKRNIMVLVEGDTRNSNYSSCRLKTEVQGLWLLVGIIIGTENRTF